MSGEFSFRDLRELFAKANEEKSGDQLARLAAGSDQERVAPSANSLICPWQQLSSSL
jgi:ethanolamine ammonia-lyase large subunit